MRNKKGVVLMMVLGTILVVTALANIVLTVLMSQSRLTHHQVSRVQAYYASKAALVYGMEMLRVGSWTAASWPPAGAGFDMLSTGAFPSTISSLRVFTCPCCGPCGTFPPCIAPATAGTTCLNAVATYTYVP